MVIIYGICILISLIIGIAYFVHGYIKNKEESELLGKMLLIFACAFGFLFITTGGMDDVIYSLEDKSGTIVSIRVIEGEGKFDSSVEYTVELSSGDILTYKKNNSSEATYYVSDQVLVTFRHWALNMGTEIVGIKKVTEYSVIQSMKQYSCFCIVKKVAELSPINYGEVSRYELLKRA